MCNDVGVPPVDGKDILWELMLVVRNANKTARAMKVGRMAKR